MCDHRYCKTQANHADVSVSIYPTTFVCDGTESSLSDCATGVSTGSLTHKSDAYVTCQSEYWYRKIRLVGSNFLDNEGRVEFHTDSAWATICIDNWSDTEANVACESLGYSNGRAMTYLRTSFDEPNANTSTGSVSISCSGREDSISKCSVLVDQTCADFVFWAGAICVPQSGITEGSVRQSDYSYLLVQVFYAGRWGTVCNTAWELDSAQVACKELGNTPSLTHIPYAYVLNYPSSQPIWIFGYTCEGSEPNLRNCSRLLYPIGYSVSDRCPNDHPAEAYCDAAPSNVLGRILIASILTPILIILVVTATVLIVLHDKFRKGPLQACYQPMWTRFLVWYRRQRGIQQQESQTVVLVSPSPPTSQSTELSRPDQTSAPPSYNEALIYEHVESPPNYSFTTEQPLSLNDNNFNES